MRNRKLVQLEINGIIEHIFQQKEQKFHSEIIAARLSKDSIPYKEFKAADGFSAPTPQGERYRLIGAGHALILEESKQAIFGGESIGYGISLDKKALDEYILANYNDWKVVHSH